MTMMERLLLFAVVVLLAPSSSFGAGNEEPYDSFGILDWIRNSKGGFVNPKQDYRQDPSPSSSGTVVGVFAKEKIEANETLLIVPWELMILVDDEDYDGFLDCELVLAVAREMSLAEEGWRGSLHEPYGRYLNAQANLMDRLPSGWSKAGKRMLQSSLGDTIDKRSMPLASWLDEEWYQECLKGQPSTPLQDKAALLVVEKSDDSAMIPALDFYNHKNGKWHNTMVRTAVDEYQTITASRTIEKGEQIYISHNDCRECFNRRFRYGTAEIFRDFGFIESFPQRWHYMGKVQFDLVKNEDDGLEVIWNPTLRFKDREQKQIGLDWFRKQIRRLQRFKIHKYTGDSPADYYSIPQKEWELIWKFYENNINAMNAAVQKLQTELGENNEDEVCSMEDSLNATDYDVLDYQFDGLNYRGHITCHNDEDMKLDKLGSVHSLQTNYQALRFLIDDEAQNVCMTLERTVQICSKYRPHYHEYFVHAAARYVESVKRVIFIGGGDSMLLYEVLKYPDLELVVGLELDQQVTRQSFKHFHTQTHFDDERVEWWFGDATKSLLLLPQDYWQSFDLVLVDLSETVMSLTVTDELDVFDALALLLKPDGVMVKNERYLEKFSRVFDNAIQIYYESPVICDQCLVMGSHTVDFLHSTLKDHGIETLLYEPLVTSENKYDLLHDYRKQDPHAAGKCEPLSMPKKPMEQENSLGITGIVEAENAAVPFDENIKELLHAAIAREGFTSLSVRQVDETLILIVMREGYVVGRFWPEKQYCGFDINLWGRLHKMKQLENSLISAIGSTLVSSYRIVVGGMYGSAKWREDPMVGPQIVQARTCGDKEVTTVPAPVGDIVNIALEETVNLVPKKEVLAAVLCGTEHSRDCASADVLQRHPNVDRVIKFWTCPDLESEDVAEQTAKMFECEKSFSRMLNQAFNQDSKADLFVIDIAASYPMLQILNIMLDDDSNRVSWIQGKNVFVAISADPSEEPWRSNFLDRYRKQYMLDPVARGEYSIQAGGEYSIQAGDTVDVQLGVVTCDDDFLPYSLVSLENGLRERFGTEGLNLSVELRTIQGGLNSFIHHFSDLKAFSQSDYNNEQWLEQSSEQQPLGSQHIFQITPQNGESAEIMPDKLDHALEEALKVVECEYSDDDYVDDIGDGVLIFYACRRGNVVLVWDGREHIDVNFFSFAEEVGLPERFVKSFLHYVSKQNELDVRLRDDLPRGTGRVVNFKVDLVN